MRIPVSKYHGLGNDFILTTYEAVKDLPDLKDFIVNVCDRHSGIGADGAIFVKEHPLEMLYYNQDGSRAPMCGNGIRCFGAYCYDEGLHREERLEVATLAGTKVLYRKSNEPYIVTVDMGKPEYEPAKIGVTSASPIWNYPLEIEGVTYQIYSFFMATVHTVVFVEQVNREEVERVGKAICHHSMFTEQTNVNFVEVIDEGHLKVMTYERGCGVTLACGTGVCASVVAAHKEHKCKESVDVSLVKGELHIDMKEDETLLMSGPAKRIMKGDYDYD